MNWIWIGLGGAIGSISRFAIGNWAQQKLEGKLPALLDFPAGTIFVNVSGSFLIGLFAYLKNSDGEPLLNPAVRLFLLVGICGGYTTFSSFSLETIQLTEKGAWLKAGWNVLASVAMCLIAVWLGHQLALLLNKPRGE